MQTPVLSTFDRSATLDALERESFDCAVIGGGITGAGIADEAARRGLRVALLEANDYAAGTSSRSSKLIHGGLRYLAMGDVALVRETALERKAIHGIAPHLAERRWMCVPARSYAGLMKFRVGIGTYEKLGAVEREDLHRNWSGDELGAEEPLLDRSHYPYACAYREYLTDDARLVLAVLRSAVRRGARALNYARVESIALENGRACGVEAVCAATGRRVRVRARAVVNAAGPWVDAVRSLEDASARPLLLLSKGIHVSLPAARLPVRHMWVLGMPDGRAIFAIPRGPVVYLGTTDTHYPRGAELWPEIGSEDVEYLLSALPRHFTVEPVKPEHCVAAWAGLRPLIAEAGKKPSEISRRDEILVGPGGVVTIAGGKLTGYRPMTRRAVDEIAHGIGAELAAVTDDEPVPGGDVERDLAAAARGLARAHALDEASALRLVRLYGSEAQAVLALGAAPLVAPLAARIGEVEWAVRVEGAVGVEDVLYRRTRVALYDAEAREAAAVAIGARMAQLLGWDAARRDAEVARATATLAADLAFARPVA